MKKFDIPEPFRFNLCKHHLHWIQDRLQQIINNPMDLGLRDNVIENIKSINSNHLDIYTGDLTPEQLIQAFEDVIRKHKITSRSEFSSWIGKLEFQLVTLTDSSVWVLREGMEDELYIHIHPARNVPNALRIHGNSWKTAIVLKIFYPDLTDIDLIVVNEIRKRYLNLSPIKELDKSQRLMTAMKLISI